MSLHKLRFIVVRGRRYLRLDDVASLLRRIGSTEETDTRDRLDEAARKLEAQSALLSLENTARPIAKDLP